MAAFIHVTLDDGTERSFNLDHVVEIYPSPKDHLATILVLPGNRHIPVKRTYKDLSTALPRP